ncbi:MAG: AAA family ATPase [Nitrospirae bacterium]|nr:MAG: AAA family ATPase [Nitrospirota bacterium]
MSKKALVTFVGKQDPWNKAGKPGPLLTLLDGRKGFSHVFLVYTKTSHESMQEKAESVAREIKKRYSVRVTVLELELKSPADHEEVYKKTRGLFSAHKGVFDKYDLFINLTSGTPQMHIALFLLAASGEIKATMLYQPDPVHSPAIKEINPWQTDMPEILPRLPSGSPEPTVESTDLKEIIIELGIVGGSKSIKEALRKAARYANTDLPVLILGPSGTGKELFANLIHKLSKRRDGRFIPFNCAALTETIAESELFGYKKGAFTGAVTDRDGLFRQADGGTLFLDEVGELSPLVQAKLLRVLETGAFTPVGGNREERVDVRLIAATNRDLDEMVNEGRFREDLYYRLNVLQIQLPPLRDRREDIPELARHILTRFCKESGVEKEFTEEALRALMRYHWPGNVRQLRTVVWRLAVETDGKKIDLSDIVLPFQEVHNVTTLPIEPYNGFNLEETVKTLEKYYYEKALEISGGNMSKAARLLGVSPQAVSQRLKTNKTGRKRRR